MLRTMLLEIAIAVIAAAALAKLVIDRQPAPPAMSTYSESDTEPGWDGPELPYFDQPLERVAYGTKPGARVFGWPAKGGVYILLVSAVEVEFLGYDRFEHVPRPDPTDPDTAADEEAHCNKRTPPLAKPESPATNVMFQCVSWVPNGGRASTHGLPIRGWYAKFLKRRPSSPPGGRLGVVYGFSARMRKSLAGSTPACCSMHTPWRSDATSSSSWGVPSTPTRRIAQT